VRNIPDEEVGIPINPAIKRHFELEIKILREAPRDSDKLRKLVKAKQRELEDAIKIEDTEGSGLAAGESKPVGVDTSLPGSKAFIQSGFA
jgi:hypothetical protein